MKGRYEKQKTQKEKKPLGAKKIALIVLLVIVAVVAAIVIAAVVYYNSLVGKIRQVDVPTIDYSALDTAPTVTGMTEATTTPTTPTVEETTVATTAPHVASSADYVNILVVGQSARANEAQEAARMADSMLLFTVNTYEKTVTMTSFLRDTQVKGTPYVDSSGRSHDWGGIKLNTVYQLGYQWDGVGGSMALMNQCLYNNFGVEVDHNFEVDFDMFIKVVDLMGGVEIELTEAEAEYLNNDDQWVYYDFEPGLERLDGMCALSFARMRKAEGDNESDIKRTARQRRLVEALIAKLKTMSVSGLNRIANEIMPMITTSMSTSEITDLLVTMISILPDLKIETGGTCPVEGMYWGDVVDIYGDGIPDSVLIFDEGSNKKAMRALTEGEGTLEN